MQAPIVYPKRVRLAQDKVLVQEGVGEGSGMEVVVCTLRNSKCGIAISILANAICRGMRIGGGLYGNCYQVTINGISYFPPRITYIAKYY